MSLFYGLAGRELFGTKDDGTAWRKLHKFWMNFVGSLVGWMCAWAVLHPIWQKPEDPDVTTAHAFYAVVAFLGITGWLPNAMVGLAHSFQAIVEKLTPK